MRISDWSSDVCSSDLHAGRDLGADRCRRFDSGDPADLSWLRSWRVRQCRIDGRRHHDSGAAIRYNAGGTAAAPPALRSEEHTSELQSLMRSSYAVFCLKKTKKLLTRHNNSTKQYKTKK